MVTMEPATKNLLMNQFTAEQCRALFPKNPNKATKKQVEKIREDLKKVKEMKPGKDFETKKAQIDRRITMMQETHGQKGLRVDIQIPDQATCQEWWVDATCIRLIYTSRITKE